MNKNLRVIGGAGGGGGGGGGGGSVPITAPDTLRSLAIVEFLDAFSEGELEGFDTVDPLQSVYLNDTPIKTGETLNFEGVTLDYRLGSQDQTYLPGDEMSTDEDASAAIEFNVNAQVKLETPVTRTISSPIANAIRVSIQVSALWIRNATTGDVTGYEVSLRIEVKASGGSFQTVDLAGRQSISGKASSPYVRSYHIELGQYGVAPYDIKVTRLSPEITDGSVADTLTWTSYTELMYAKLRYPNTALARLTFDARHFQQVPKRGYKLKGIKVRVPGPDFYDPVLRAYTGTDWDGTFVTAWTRCPAWIFYDILTDPRYGLGKEVPEAYIDKWNLFTIAQRCDAVIPDGFGGTEPRYSLDLYLQQSNSAKKVIQDIASNFDAMGFWHGGGVFVTQDAPKSVSALYTPANIISGRFIYAGSARQVRYTVALVQWNDPADFYKIATEYVEDTDGIARYGYREKKVVAVGCTSRGQAHRAGKRILLTSRLETDVVGFSVGLSGLVNKTGDIIRLSDPLKHNNLRLGGRLSEGSTTTTIEIDSAVTLEAGQSYTVCLVMPDASVITAPVTNAAETTQTLTTFPPLSQPPDHAALWSVYSGAVPSVEYRILWINENNTEDDGGFYEISAVKYDPSKYTEVESNLALEPIYQVPYASTNTVIPPTGVVTQEGTYVGLEGIVRYLDISWTASDDQLLLNHVVRWSLNKGEETEVKITGAAYRIETVKEGTYQISVHAINIGGQASSSVTVNHIVGILYAISAVSITNLTIKGLGGNTFEGRNAEFDWDTDADTVVDLSDSFGAGVGGQNPLYRDFVVKVFEGANLLRTEYVTESAYVYTYEKNVEDGGPFRAISVEVAARDLYGNLSNNAVLSVSNPAPTTFSNITLTAGLGQIFVEYFPPTDPDYIYTRIFASQTSGFTPDATGGTGNMVAEGSDRVISFPVSDGTWYIRLQGIDEFGVSGAVYSSQLSTVVASSDVTAEVDAILADPGRNGDFVVETDRFIIVQPSTYATPTAVFAVGTVDGVSSVGIRGELLVDGSITAISLAASTITADKLLVSQLSAITADIGLVTAGTLKTSPVETGWRVEVSDAGAYPIWYGTGTKNSSNAKFYLDDSGNAYFAGQLAAATGTFEGSMTAGTIDINSGQFHVDQNGVATLKAVVVLDDAGNVLLSSGTGTEWQYVTGLDAPEDNATVGADFDTNLVNIPYETIINNDDATALGFNPTFSAWDGVAPDNWVSWNGDPIKETVIVNTGNFSVKLVATGESGGPGITRTHDFAGVPLAMGTFFSGSIDIYLETVTAGLPGMLVRLYKDAALTTYKDVKIQPVSSVTGTWTKLPWTAKQADGELIYGFRIYLMGSWVSLPTGEFTGTCYFDNLNFILLDASLDNESITVDADGKLIGAGGGQVTIAGLGYTGDLDADVTATNTSNNTINVGSSTASEVSTATINFNNNNDRLASPIVNPTVISDGTAIDHVLNSDGSIDLTFEWLWAGNDNEIDGFIIYSYSNDASASYNFGSNPTKESASYIPSGIRAFGFLGLASDRFYTFGIQAYRVVDTDINLSGILKSNLVQPGLATENPYQGEVNSAFSGDLTGTINGAPIGDLATQDTADFETQLSNIPAETIYNNDDSTAYGFNPTFSAWSGTYPDNWSLSSSSNAISKESTIVNIGDFSVKCVGNGLDNVGIKNVVSSSGFPLPLGVVLSGSVDIYLETVVSGLPGILVRLFTQADLAVFTDSEIQPQISTTGEWIKVPWVAKVPAGKQIFGIQINLMGSWSSFATGQFNGVCYFDNLNFALFSPSFNNETISVDAGGSLLGAGGGQVTITGLGYTGELDANNTTNTTQLIDGANLGDTALWTGVLGDDKPDDNADVTSANSQGADWLTDPVVWLENKITSANISTYMAAVAITDAYIASLDAAKIVTGFLDADRIEADVVYVDTGNFANLSVTEAKIGDLEITTGKILDNAITSTSSVNASNVFVPASWATTVTLTITVPPSTQKDVVILYGCSGFVGNVSGGWVDISVRLLRESTVIQTHSEIVTEAFSYPFKDTPAAGTYTYSLQVLSGEETATIKENNLTILTMFK